MSSARKKRSSLFAIAIALTAVLVPPSAHASRANDVDLLLTSMNHVRSASHLRPLRLDARLCRIAYAHALDMDRRNYFAHVTPEGMTPFARMAASHYRFGYAGENLAVDQNAELVFTDFWTSREHRANMLGAHYKHVGIGSVKGRVGTIVVEDFSD